MTPTCSRSPANCADTMLVKNIASNVDVAAKDSATDRAWMTVGPPVSRRGWSLPLQYLRRVSSDGTSALMKALMNTGATAVGAMPWAEIRTVSWPLRDMAAGATFTTALMMTLTAVSMAM